MTAEGARLADGHSWCDTGWWATAAGMVTFRRDFDEVTSRVERARGAIRIRIGCSEAVWARPGPPCGRAERSDESDGRATREEGRCFVVGEQS